MQLAGSDLVKNCFTITHRWEQTQQMCEMRKEIYFSPISMRPWPIVGHPEPEKKNSVGIFEYILASVLKVYLDVF